MEAVLAVIALGALAALYLTATKMRKGARCDDTATDSDLAGGPYIDPL